MQTDARKALLLRDGWSDFDLPLRRADPHATLRDRLRDRLPGWLPSFERSGLLPTLVATFVVCVVVIVVLEPGFARAAEGTASRGLSWCRVLGVALLAVLLVALWPVAA